MTIVVPSAACAMTPPRRSPRPAPPGSSTPARRRPARPHLRQPARPRPRRHRPARPDPRAGRRPHPQRPARVHQAREAREFSRTEGFSAGTRGSDAVIAVGVSQVPGWGRSHGASGSFTTGWRAQGALASWPPGWPVLSCDWHRAGSGWRVRPVRGCPRIGEADPFLHSVFQPLVG
jgi:hypothetical protein